MNNSIRLVRCPKCRKILPELPNISVYKCGGCGATLQAKKQRNEISRNGSRAQSTDHIQKYEPTVLSSHSRKGDHPAIKSSPEVPIDNHTRSTEPNFLQAEKLSRERNESKVQDEPERQLGKKAGPRKISLDSSEKSHDRTSDEIFSSCDSFLEYESSAAEISISRKNSEGYSRKKNVIQSVNEHSKVDEGNYLSRGNVGMRPNAFADQIVEHSQKRETSDKTSFPMKDRHTADSSLVAEKYSIENSRRQVVKSLGKEKREENIAARAPLIRGLVPAPLSPDDIYLKDSPATGPNIPRISSDETLDTSPINPKVPTASLSPDDISSKGSPETGIDFHHISSEEMLDTLPINARASIAQLSPDDIYLEGSPKVGPRFHRISSEEMLDTSPINPRFPIRSVSKSPPKAYYAGDDESEYSYDGTEELSAHVTPPYSRKVKGTGTANTNRSRQMSGFRVKNKQSGELRNPNEQFSSLSKFKEPNKFSGAEQNSRRHDLPKPIKHSRPVRTSMAAANNEPISRDSYMPRSPLFHGNESLANSTHNTFMHNGEFRQPDTMSGSDPEKAALLRMVYALEDKINRAQMSKPVSGERLSSRDALEAIRTGAYYHDPPTGKNPYADFKYSGPHGSHSTGVGWGNYPRSPRLAFSGEASQCRNHVDCRCSQCYHQNMHLTPKLSSHCIHCQHAAQKRNDYDNMYPSYSPSPQHYSSSQFTPEIQADQQKNDHERKKLYLKEKPQGMKRHLRPVSGGVPIISCYNCSDLLQLPADFILFRKRCHQLRCSSCKTILKFSILKRSHLVPYVIKIRAPLPNEMDNYGNIVGSATLASTSDANNRQDAGPVSISDELVPSLSRNGSTESGPSVASSTHIINETKRLTVMEVYGMSKSPRENIEAAGPSSSTATWMKPSSKYEEQTATSNSPLHRLMGYESARQVLFSKFNDESDDDMEFFRDRQII